MQRQLPARSALGLAAALTLAIGVSAAALAHRAAAPKVVGNAKAGKPLFQTTCGVCHQLKAAGSVANIGPDLNKLSLSEAVIVKAIANGGATVMGKAQAGKYTTQMIAYRNALTATQIQDIAAFVYTSMHTR
jgi:mono/diheme cytochrome c family protein